MREEADQYLKSAVVWAKESKQILKDMRAAGQGDTPEYASIAASVATYQVLKGIALLVDEGNERAEARSEEIHASLVAIGDGIAGVRSDLEHLVVEVDGPQQTAADLDPVLRKLEDIAEAIEESGFGWDSREASRLMSDVDSIRSYASSIESDASSIRSYVSSIEMNMD